MADYGNIVLGYHDPVSGQPCAWAGLGGVCLVPDCTYPDERCFAVQRERGFPPAVPPSPEQERNNEL